MCLVFGRPERLGKVLVDVLQLEWDTAVHATRLLQSGEKKQFVTRATCALLALRAFNTTSRGGVE